MEDKENFKFQISNFKLLRIWFMVAKMAARTYLLNLLATLLFLVGKVVRFLLFFAFLFAVLSSNNTLAGYNREQVIFFFLVFNLVDIMVQFFFRGVYQFRPIFGWTDIFDFITLIPLWLLPLIYYFALFVF